MKPSILQQKASRLLALDQRRKAQGITLADAIAYFVGQTFTQEDEVTKLTAVKVEQV